MDLKSKLENKILSEIPILKSLGIEIQSLDTNASVISLPLLPNINHKGTAFGGSLYAACTAACYALIYSRQIESQLEDRDLVIIEGQMKYLKSVKEDFTVKATMIEKDWQNLVDSLKIKKPEKLMVLCDVNNGAAVFQGQFALLPQRR